MEVETEKSNNLYLYIDLPRFDFPIIFSELVRLLAVTARCCLSLISLRTGSCGIDLPATFPAACDARPNTPSTCCIFSHRPIHVGCRRPRHSTRQSRRR